MRLRSVCIFGFVIVSLFPACTSRVIRQTETSAVIEGKGPTMFEAKANATAKAEELLGKVKVVGKEECAEDRQLQANSTANALHAQETAEFRCVLQFEKQ